MCLSLIHILHGDAGAGKTKAAVKYYRDNPQSTVYIRLDPSMSGLAGDVYKRQLRT